MPGRFQKFSPWEKAGRAPPPPRAQAAFAYLLTKGRFRDPCQRLAWCRPERRRAGNCAGNGADRPAFGAMFLRCRGDRKRMPGVGRDRSRGGEDGRRASPWRRLRRARRSHCRGSGPPLPRRTGANNEPGLTHGNPVAMLRNRSSVRLLSAMGPSMKMAKPAVVAKPERGIPVSRNAGRAAG